MNFIYKDGKDSGDIWNGIWYRGVINVSCLILLLFIYLFVFSVSVLYIFSRSIDILKS